MVLVVQLRVYPIAGLQTLKGCVVLPLATGMALVFAMLTLKINKGLLLLVERKTQEQKRNAYYFSSICSHDSLAQNRSENLLQSDAHCWYRPQCILLSLLFTGIHFTSFRI